MPVGFLIGFAFIRAKSELNSSLWTSDGEEGCNLAGACPRTRTLRDFHMQIPNMRCTAITKRTGERCCGRVVAPFKPFCKYHDPEVAPLTHQRNREATKKYWDGYRLAKVIAEAGKKAA